MRTVALFIFLISFAHELTAQINKYGVPIIRNYTTQITQGSEQNWCITKDKFGNIYFGNQDRGVIRYDGTKWSAIQIANNPRIYSLESDSRGIVFVGAAFEFGYLQPDNKGKTEYISLSARIDSIPEIRFVYSIVIQDDKVLFLSPRFIYVYEVNKDKLSKISLIGFGLPDAYRLVKINDKLIISDINSGIFELNDSIVTPLPGGDFFKKKPCTVLLPYEGTKILVSTFYDGLYLYDYKTGSVSADFIDKKLNDKLKEVSIYAATKIRDDLFAIGTTNQEGIMVFNKSGELISQIRKEDSDLEDNTIIAMYCNYQMNSELWIATQGFISKAYFNVPLTKFSEKQGILTGVNEISSFGGNIYLSCDAGVLKSRTDNQNTYRFEKISGINTQVFPLELIKNPSGDFLLAGSLNGALQITKSNAVIKLEGNCDNIPKNLTDRFNAKKILQSSIDPEVVYFGLESGGVIMLRYRGSRWHYITKTRSTPGLISGIVEMRDGGVWFLTDDPSSLYRWKITGADTLQIRYGPEKGVPDIDKSSIHFIRDELYITTSHGLLKYDKASDSFSDGNGVTGGYSQGIFSQNLFSDSEGDLWFSGIDKRAVDLLFRTTKNPVERYSGVLNFLPNVPLMDIMDQDGKIYLLKSKNVFVADKGSLINDSSVVNTSFVRIIAGQDSVVMDGTFYKSDEHNRRVPISRNTTTTTPEFSYDMNQLIFEWTTSNYTEELLTEYSTKLDGYDKDWSKWEGISFGNNLEAQYSKRDFPNLAYGRYTFRVRARTLVGLTGNELSYEFIILKPWYATIIAYFGFALAAFLIIFAIFKAYIRKLKNENIRLEGIVVERTAVVVKQKEELESSIHYARRIQMALLPSETILSENVKNYFVLFKPRDIVSGDFYWMTKKGERLYIVAADCTGHGVPGAFMSLLGMSFLDEIIDRDLAPRADHILRELRLHVTESLKQVGSDNEAKDGMDMGLLVIDYNTQRIEFSGAYNPCFRVRKLSEEEAGKQDDKTNESSEGSVTDGKYILETILASKMPIGISPRMNEDFKFHDFPLEKGVSYYLFSDGYIDQFGGPDGRKFMKKSFKRLLLNIQDHPMQMQKELLDTNLKEWMGTIHQIDDILVMGIRID